VNDSAIAVAKLAPLAFRYVFHYTQWRSHCLMCDLSSTLICNCFTTSASVRLCATCEMMWLTVTESKWTACSFGCPPRKFTIL